MVDDSRIVLYDSIYGTCNSPDRAANRTLYENVGSRVVTGQPDELLSPKEVAAELGLSYRKIKQLLASGALPYYRLGKDPRSGYRVGRSDLDHYIASLRAKGSE